MRPSSVATWNSFHQLAISTGSGAVPGGSPIQCSATGDAGRRKSGPTLQPLEASTVQATANDSLTAAPLSQCAMGAPLFDVRFYVQRSVGDQIAAGAQLSRV